MHDLHGMIHGSWNRPWSLCHMFHGAQKHALVSNRCKNGTPKLLQKVGKLETRVVRIIYIHIYNILWQLQICSSLSAYLGWCPPPTFTCFIDFKTTNQCHLVHIHSHNLQNISPCKIGWLLNKTLWNTCFNATLYTRFYGKNAFFNSRFQGSILRSNSDPDPF